MQTHTHTYKHTHTNTHTCTHLHSCTVTLQYLNILHCGNVYPELCNAMHNHMILDTSTIQERINTRLLVRYALHGLVVLLMYVCILGV